jgi:hypothetical protein
MRCKLDDARVIHNVREDRCSDGCNISLLSDVLGSRLSPPPPSKIHGRCLNESLVAQQVVVHRHTTFETERCRIEPQAIVDVHLSTTSSSSHITHCSYPSLPSPFFPSRSSFFSLPRAYSTESRAVLSSFLCPFISSRIIMSSQRYERVSPSLPLPLSSISVCDAPHIHCLSLGMPY